MKRSIPFLAATCALAAAVPGCADDERPSIPAGRSTPATPVPEPGPGTGAVVYTRTFIYRPDPLTVRAGTRVAFHNLDATVHTVTAGTRAAPRAGRFDGHMGEGGRFAYTFDRPGRYPYFCSIHSGDGMTGEIVVR